MVSFYEDFAPLPPDPIFGLSAQFKADPRSDKFTLITGYFRDETLNTPILESVAAVEKQLAEKRGKKEYLPIDGDLEFIHLLEKLVFGKNEERICGVQTVGGTGALYLIGKLATHWTKQIAISNPSWANHWNIFSKAGLKTIPYFYYEKGRVAFDKMVAELSALPEKTCVLLHTNCHNPSGADLSFKEWQEVLEVTEKRGLFPILDMAYQGFSAPPEEDAYAARLFLERGHPFALTYTCAKNFSIYGERAGALFVVGESSKKMGAVKSHLMAEIRTSYSNPPLHAAAIVKGVLQDEKMYKKWLEELEKMRMRMEKIRRSFVEKMKKRDPKGPWEAVSLGKGLFCLSGLSTKTIEALRKEKGFYIAMDGRINLTGLNEVNIEAFTDALSKEIT